MIYICKCYMWVNFRVFYCLTWYYSEAKRTFSLFHVLHQPHHHFFILTHSANIILSSSTSSSHLSLTNINSKFTVHSTKKQKLWATDNINRRWGKLNHFLQYKKSGTLQFLVVFPLLFFQRMCTAVESTD